MRTLISHLLLSLTATLTLMSCSKDSPVTEENHTSYTEVMVLFSPSQLGDVGYSDKIFKGMKEYETSYDNNITNSVDFSYISCDTDSATLNSLKKWATTAHSPFNADKEFSRRLLVLTMPWQVQLLDSIQLRESDEILLVDAQTDITDSLSTTHWGKRVHSLNISAAASIERFITFVKEKGAFGDNEKEKSLIFYPSLSTLARTDSIHEMLQMKSTGNNIEVLEENIGITTKLTDDFINILNETSYNIAQHYFSKDTYPDYNKYAIVNCRSANKGVEFYIIKDYVSQYSTLFIDGTENNYIITRTYYVSRDFSKAIILWINQWSRNSIGNMPKHQWHGEWDGFCTNNIEKFVD